MKLEKRSSGAPTEQPQAPQSNRKKPVVVYIMVLFIAAFLLMTLSFFTTQRSNEKMIGKLREDVTLMHRVQTLEDQNRWLSDNAKQNQATLERAQTEVLAAQTTASALETLYQLEHTYAAGDMETCRQLTETLTAQADFLPDDAFGDIPSPAAQFQELQTVLENN